MQHPGSTQTVGSPLMHPAHRMFGPFSPGMTMSPGAFWGRPGPGHAGNPYLNPAVGSPVLMHQSGVPGSPGGFFTMQAQPEEPSGYFPPVAAGRPPDTGYFPPVPVSSGLAHEISRDGYEDADGGTQTQSNSGSASARSDAGTDLGLRDSAGGLSSRATSWSTDGEGVDDAARRLEGMHVGGDNEDAAKGGRTHSRSAGSNAPPPPPALPHKTHSDQTGVQQAAATTSDDGTALPADALRDSELDASVISPAARRSSWGMEFAEQRRQSALKGIGLGFRHGM